MVKKQGTDNSSKKNTPEFLTDKAPALPVSNYTPVSEKLVSLVIDRLLKRHYIGGGRWDHVYNLYHDVYKGVKHHSYDGQKISISYEITGQISRWFGRIERYSMGFIYLGLNDDETVNNITVNIHGTCAKNKRFAQDIKDLFPSVEVEMRHTADLAFKV